jgi:hypothetical protein
MTTDQRAPISGPDAPGGAQVPQNPLNGAHSLTSDAWAHVRADRPTADLRGQGGYVAHAPSECLNGCESQQGDARSKVFCEPGQLLCPRCQSRLDKWLRDLPTTYALLPSVLAHGTVPADPGTKHTKRPDPPAPMRLEVTDLLDTRNGRGVLGVVHSWAELVRDQRRLPRRCTCGHMALGHQPPGAVRCTAKKCACHGYTPHPPSVTEECHLLAANLPWATGQDFAGELYEEIRQLNRTLTDTIGDYRARPVGRCAVLVDLSIGDGADTATVKAPCGGALVMDREGHGVRCVKCGTEIRADEGLRALGLIVGQMFGDDGSNLKETA